MKRRDILRGASVLGLYSGFSQGSAVTAWANGAPSARPKGRDPRLVLVILRGGMDGLAAIAPYADRYYSRSRSGLAIAQPGRPGGVLDLGGFYGAHPALAHWQRAFVSGEALAVHALASPYRERSHFDAQNVLDLGLAKPHVSDQGWLNRALTRVQAQAIAIGQSVPLVLRGSQVAASWTPETLPEPDADILARLQALYRHDPLLSRSLDEALAADEMSGVGGSQPRSWWRAALSPLFAATARFLTHPTGPRIAVIEVEGWDTHANQGLQQGALARGLSGLDRGFATLHQALGDAWQQTVIMAITEFGRTVAMNGTGGTDHGTAGVALLMGGALAGGRVLADWPGLKSSQLYQGRDLMPTTDIRSLYRAVLGQHMGLMRTDLDRIFPATAQLPNLDLVATTTR